MKYLLMMGGTKAGWEKLMTWPKKDIQAHIAFMSPERAYEIAAGASAAPGLGGAPMIIPIEVREIMSGPPKEL